jgi:hypothetical protein
MGLDGLAGGRVDRDVHLVAALQAGQRGAQNTESAPLVSTRGIPKTPAAFARPTVLLT